MNRIERWTPSVFVVIWSSGFVVAKYAVAHSDVLFFLAIRLLIAALILALIAVALGHTLRLNRRELAISCIIGITLQGFYLGGVWEAIALGSPAGVASVVTSTQPIFVSIFAYLFLRERLRGVQIVGLILGFTGVLFVLSPALSPTLGSQESLSYFALVLLLLGLSGSTSATLIQRKIGGNIPLLAGTTFQFFFAGIILSIVSLLTGRTRMEWNLQALFVMSWAVIVTSIIAVVALLWMLQRGSAARVSALLFLVPPMTAIQAWILFGEKLNAQAVIGIAMTALGVALVQKS